MTNKALRILIAEEDHDQLLCIEKQLNRFGYYCVAPVRTFVELVRLTSHPQERVDLLIMNRELTLPHGVFPSDFCRVRPHIVNTLFYEGRPNAYELVIECQIPCVNASLAGVPNSQTLAVLMNVIDPSRVRKNLGSLAPAS